MAEISHICRCWWLRSTSVGGHQIKPILHQTAHEKALTDGLARVLSDVPPQLRRPVGLFVLMCSTANKWQVSVKGMKPNGAVGMAMSFAERSISSQTSDRDAALTANQPKRFAMFRDRDVT